MGRAELKRSVAEGRTKVMQIILDPPELLRVSINAKPITALDVLTWQHRWGRARARRFLLSVEVSETAALLNLSPVTRQRIVDALVASV